jgi:hypothetical protein
LIFELDLVLTTWLQLDSLFSNLSGSTWLPIVEIDSIRESLGSTTQNQKLSDCFQCTFTSPICQWISNLIQRFWTWHLLNSPNKQSLSHDSSHFLLKLNHFSKFIALIALSNSPPSQLQSPTTSKIKEIVFYSVSLSLAAVAANLLPMQRKNQTQNDASQSYDAFESRKWSLAFCFEVIGKKLRNSTRLAHVKYCQRFNDNG